MNPNRPHAECRRCRALTDHADLDADRVCADCHADQAARQKALDDAAPAQTVADRRALRDRQDRADRTLARALLAVLNHPGHPANDVDAGVVESTGELCGEARS